MNRDVRARPSEEIVAGYTKPTFFESLKETFSPSPPEFKPDGTVYFCVFPVDCEWNDLFFCLEITGEEIEAADQQLAESRRNLGETISETYDEKKHGNDQSFNLPTWFETRFLKLIFFSDLMEAASHARDRIETTVSDTLHGKLFLCSNFVWVNLKFFFCFQ